MQYLHTPSSSTFFFLFPPKPLLNKPSFLKLPPPFPPLSKSLSLHAFSSEEFPVDDDDAFLAAFAPKDTLTEDQARRLNWIDRGWAPWEEILTPEGRFARASLNEGEEVPLQTPESLEAFRMLSPNYRKKKIQEMGLTEDEYYAKQFEIPGEVPDELRTVWAGPLVVRHVAPRDWPPRGWEVDKEELEFIREGHKIHYATRIDFQKLEEEGVRKETGDMCLDRYRMFLKQYNVWVDANKDRLEEESYKVWRIMAYI